MDQEKSPMDLLDSPTLLNIFRNFPLKDRILCRRVRTQWKDLLMMRELFKNQRTIGLRLTENNLTHVDDRIRKLYRKEVYVRDTEIVRYQCCDADHDPQPNDIIEAHAFQNTTHFIAIIEQYPNLKCLDMRGAHLTDGAVNALIEHAKNLECVHINFLNVSDLEAWKLFVEKVIPKIKHLSLDSCINFPIADYCPYEHLFKSGTQLEHLSIVFYACSRINVSSFRALHSTVRELSIFSLGFKRVGKVFDNIRQSDALTHIRNLRLHSDRKYRIRCHTDSDGNQRIESYTKSDKDLVTVMSEHIGSFRNLQALSMSGFFVADIEIAPYYLNSLKNMPKLTDLSLFFNGCGTTELFEEFAKHTFEKITVLKLDRVVIKGNFDVRKAFPNVALLKLVDASFDKPFFESIANLEKLKNLHIEYESRGRFQFTVRRARILKAIIDRALLKELLVKNWYGLGKNILTECATNLCCDGGLKFTYIENW